MISSLRTKNPGMARAFATPVVLIVLGVWLGVAFYFIEHDFDASIIHAKDHALTVGSGDETAQGLRKLGSLAVGVIGGALLALNWRTLLPRLNIAHLALLCVALLWSFASYTWSEEPSLTFRRLFVLSCYLTGALGVISVMRPEDFARIVLGVCVSYTGFGIFAELAMGTFDFGREGYEFAGTLHPNSQAATCAMTAITALALYHDPRLQHVNSIFLLLTIAACFIGFTTGSRTVLAGMAISIAVVTIVGFAPRLRVFAYGLLAIPLFIAGTVLVLQQDYAELANGVDLAFVPGDYMEELQTLNGRVPVWEALFDRGDMDTIRGTGLGAFWTDEHQADVFERVSWLVTSAHSAYVDTFTELGLVGLVLWGAVVLNSLRLFAGQFRLTTTPTYLFCFGILSLGIVVSLSESIFYFPSFATFCGGTACCYALLKFEQDLPEAQLDELPSLRLMTAE